MTPLNTWIDAKTVSSLIAVLVGWLLAQFSGLLRDHLNRRRVRRCLLEELQELQGELDRLTLKYARQLQIHALNGIDNNLPLPLSNHIFKNFYKDAVLSLNQEQRISYQLIHSYVEQINTGIERASEVTRRIQEQATTEVPRSVGPREGELWGQTVIAGFVNAAVALWHVDHHLRHPLKPELSLLSETHQDYLIYQQRVEDRIKEIMEAAKNMDREEFRRVYRPEDFVNKTFHSSRN